MPPLSGRGVGRTEVVGASVEIPSAFPLPALPPEDEAGRPPGVNVPGPPTGRPPALPPEDADGNMLSNCSEEMISTCMGFVALAGRYTCFGPAGVLTVTTSSARITPGVVTVDSWNGSETGVAEEGFAGWTDPRLTGASGRGAPVTPIICAKEDGVVVN